MKFCKECGEKLTDENKDCPKCGTVVLSDPTKPATTKGITNVNFLENLSKKHKVIIISVLAVFIFAFIGIRIGNSIATPERFVDSFQQALIDNDMDQLSKYIVSSDPRLKVDEGSIEAFLAHINNNPSFLGELTNSLNQQTEALEGGHDSTKEVFGDAKDNEHILTLRKQGKNMLFFDRYVVEPMAYYITLYTNYPDTKLYINGEEIDITHRMDFAREYGPFMPGVYTLKAVLEGEFVDLEVEEELIIFDIYHNHVSVNLHLYGSHVNPTSNYNDTRVFANGIDTGLTVSDISEFGPVSTDGSVVLHGVKEFPWGTIESDEVKLTGQSSAHLAIPAVNDELNEQLMEAMNSYYLTSIAALMELDASLLKNTTPNNVATIESDIDHYTEYGHDYHMELKEILYDLSSVSLFQEDGQYKAHISARQYLQYTDYSYFDENGEHAITNPDYDSQHILVYDKDAGEWQYKDSHGLWSINTHTIKSFEF
ncbi:membrane protein-like protein [Alkaliphilus metalliredigens QYMF]|uniref:Membrane protein-like protein n=1 Tax=Alkaliphilus metalliredigens (strain QYMF) TaxID=293826 RepID=A6TJV4_ALKMQ|nr:zinc-ribbon domain-containing protein [Alkaliphilus metalliredigens]ABR46472.1 membrane protein-like protein [Alkaliphilus metalliredigens QYMF]